MSEQKRLLSIVHTWDIKDIPEYRGFRCADCQRDLKDKAWHYFLSNNEYQTPIHFCENCKLQFENSTSNGSVDAKRSVRLNSNYNRETVEHLRKIRKSWESQQKSMFKSFICDECGNDLPSAKGYHAWFQDGEILVEYHFDKACAQKLSIHA